MKRYINLMPQLKKQRPAPVYSFPPISAPDARVLILGTMPGVASLTAEQYYAHPQNSFWRIMGEIAGARREFSYEQRVEILQQKKIAVWDVLQCCVRPGSLDSAITQEMPNDFASFFTAHPRISHVFFNGAPASKFFKKFVMKNEAVAEIISARDISLTPLPSTSPANASWNFQRKLEAWRQILTQ
jgi:TDG/mug DNA glycosylase family protein